MSDAIRDATRGDLEQIVAIYNATVPSRMVTADVEPVAVAEREGWFAQHAPQRRPLWVVEREGRIAGWLSLSDFYGRPAYERSVEVSVYVHDGHRRAGIGRLLLAHAVAQAPQLGIDTFLAFIFAHNLPSLALFERFGFTQWGALPRIAVLDGIERDVVIAGRRL
jgi:phosphinothricin acetyltransferase